MNKTELRLVVANYTMEMLTTECRHRSNPKQMVFTETKEAETVLITPLSHCYR